MRLGVIDCGSNSVRLVVYEVKGGRESRREGKPFRTLFDEKKMAGLSSYVEDGVLTAAGIDKAASVLGDLLRLADNLKCERVGIFATAVLRNCANSRAATQIIEEAIDHKVHVLTAKEEAHLGFVGASIGRDLDAGTLIDIGGGSAELTALRPDGDHAGISLPGGCVAFYARYVRLVMPTIDECRAMAEAFNELLNEAGDLAPYRTTAAFGIGGSLRAVSKLLAQVRESEKPTTVTREDIDELFALLERDPSAYAHAVVKAAPDRVHSLTPGMAIARTLTERLGVQKITLCKYGIREGYLLDRML